jgi:uncharacterized protein YjbI with pentapeptide repeats
VGSPRAEGPPRRTHGSSSLRCCGVSPPREWHDAEARRADNPVRHRPRVRTTSGEPVSDAGGMRLLSVSDLTHVEQELCEAAAEGRTLDLRPGQHAENDPATGGPHWEDRRIRPQVIHQLLSGRGDLDEAFGPALAVRVRGAEVPGALFLDNLTLRCALKLHQCRIIGELHLTKSRALDLSFSESFLRGNLEARRLLVDHDLDLSSFKCEGQIVLTDAHVRGFLDCNRINISFAKEVALKAARISVDSSLNLIMAKILGGIELHGANITGGLNLNGAHISRAGAQALEGDHLTVHGNMTLRNAVIVGQIWLPFADIKNQLSATNMTVTHDNDFALHADGLSAGAGLTLMGAKIDGLRIPRARINSQLNLRGATLSCTPGNVAVLGDLALLDGNVVLDNASVKGEFRLYGANITGAVSIDGATLDGAQGWALNLSRLRSSGIVKLSPASLKGGVSLSFATVGSWLDNRETWPKRLDLAGFAYDEIEAPEVGINDRLGWIRREPGYSPQPYEQLAAVNRRAGNDAAARAVMIAKQRERRRSSLRRAARWPNSAWSFFLRWTIGYGYRPGRVLPWFLALFGAGVIALNRAYPTQFTRTRGGEGVEFHAISYVLDLLLPVANLKQRDAFVPHGYAYWWVLGLTLSGWLLAAVLVAGLSGVFKRE